MNSVKGYSLGAEGSEDFQADLAEICMKYKVPLYEGANLLVEIKDGSKPPSAQKLTGPEKTFHALWPGWLAIANSVEAALKYLGAINE